MRAAAPETATDDVCMQKQAAVRADSPAQHPPQAQQHDETHLSILGAQALQRHRALQDKINAALQGRRQESFTSLQMQRQNRYNAATPDDEIHLSILEDQALHALLDLLDKIGTAVDSSLQVQQQHGGQNRHNAATAYDETHLSILEAQALQRHRALQDKINAALQGRRQESFTSLQMQRQNRYNAATPDDEIHLSILEDQALQRHRALLDLLDKIGTAVDSSLQVQQQHGGQNRHNAATLDDLEDRASQLRRALQAKINALSSRWTQRTTSLHDRKRHRGAD